MTPKLTLPAIFFGAAALVGCNGVFGNIYDNDEADTISNPADGLIVDAANPGRFTLTLDASAFTTWHFVSLDKMSVSHIDIPTEEAGNPDGRSGITYNEVAGDNFTPYAFTPTAAQPEPEGGWHFAIHRFDVRTNGGSACVTSLTDINDALELDSSSLVFTPDIWSTHDVMVDLTGMMAWHIGYQNSWVNPVLSGWVTMDISTPPPTFSATGRVYVLRLADGSEAALQMRSYFNEKGEKGHLTIDIIYPL